MARVLSGRGVYLVQARACGLGLGLRPIPAQGKTVSNSKNRNGFKVAKIIFLQHSKRCSLLFWAGSRCRDRFVSGMRKWAWRLSQCWVQVLRPGDCLLMTAFYCKVIFIVDSILITFFVNPQWLINDLRIIRGAWQHNRIRDKVLGPIHTGSG